MDLTMFKYHDECGRIGFTEDMVEKKNEFYDDLDYHSKQRFDSFLNFIKVKNEKDDFSKVIYFGIDSEIIIECKEHGEYNSTPYRYMKQNRCPYCGNKRMSRIEYETKLKNKFPYLNIIGEYINTKHDIKVKCTFCGGEKEINAGMLLNSKFGCNCLNNKKPYTKEEYENVAFNKNLKVLEPFINTHTPIMHECLKCGYKWKVFPSWITTEFKLCPKCSALNQSLTKRKSLDEINEKLMTDNRNLICLEYNGAFNDSQFKCLKCNHVWWNMSNSVMQGASCPECLKLKLSNQKIYTIEHINDILNKNNKTFICIKRNNFDDPTFKCKICGYEWKHSVKCYLENGSCPSCNLTKGEERVRDFLEKYNIDYEVEKTFKGCKYKGSLRFDFYIPSQNACIEYDGEQHFDTVDFEGGSSEKQLKENLKENKKRDSIKDKYCKKNGIKLLRIPYYEFDNIENKLIEFLNIDWMFY